jgi:hypothetical protein
MSEGLRLKSRGTLSTTARTEGRAPARGGLNGKHGRQMRVPRPAMTAAPKYCAELSGQNGRCMRLCGRGAVLLRNAIGRTRCAPATCPRHRMRSRSGTESRCGPRSDRCQQAFESGRRPGLGQRRRYRRICRLYLRVWKKIAPSTDEVATACRYSAVLSYR